MIYVIGLQADVWRMVLWSAVALKQKFQIISF
jgi:hypothetical protein